MPIMVAPQAGEPVLAEPAEIAAGDRHTAGARPFEPGEHHHQGRFARARGPDNATVSPGSMVSEMPRKISTGPPALGKVRQISASATSGEMAGGVVIRCRRKVGIWPGLPPGQRGSAARLTAATLLPSV